MTIDIFQVDAFVGKGFKGNPAAVCPLTKWIDAQVMQDIAEENNLSEISIFSDSPFSLCCISIYKFFSIFCSSCNYIVS